MRRRLVTFLALVLAMLMVPGLARADWVAVAGDISPPPWESGTNDHLTSAIVDNLIYANVIATGDLQYQESRLEDYQSPLGWSESGAWGSVDIMKKLWPVGGNHEGMDPAGYYKGFCTFFAASTVPTGCNTDVDRNGTPDGIWWTQKFGWTFIFLNSGCGDQPGSPSCAGGSPQDLWLNHILKYVAKEGDPGAQCTALVFHEPFKSSSAPYSGEPKMVGLWSRGVKNHVDLALNGHNHAEEQMKPFRASGIVDYDSGPGDGDDGLAGIRTVVAGGGGRSLIGYTKIDPRSLYRKVAYGIWEADFRPGSWRGRFRYVNGAVEFDRSVGCH